VSVREQLVVHQHSDHNEVILFWFTSQYVVTEKNYEDALVYDAYVLSLFVESSISPSTRDAEWSGLFRQRIAGVEEPWREPLMHDREGAYQVAITPDGFRTFETALPLELEVTPPIEQYVMLEAMVARMRELLSHRPIVAAITRAMRSTETQTTIKIP
jgi:hypothetical protein